MPIQLNLDTIRNLDANKTYYLSNTTGEIKEAGFWQKLKCVFGVKSALLKVSNLVDAVRTSLLQEAGIKSNDELDENIRTTINFKDSVKGSVLKDLVKRFAVTDEQTIMKNKASKAVQNSVRNAVIDFMEANPEIGDAKSLATVFSHALKPALNGSIPVVREEGKPTKLNTSKFINQSVKPLEKELANLLVEISKNANLKNPKIDALYAKHIIATLFNEDGTRNEKGIDALKSPEEVRVRYAFQLDENVLNNRAKIVYKDLLEKHIDPLAKLNTIMSYCGGDKALESVVLNIVPTLCLTSNNSLRSEESIKAKIAAIKDNIDELRALGYMTKKGELPEIFKIAFANLDGIGFPKGLLGQIHEKVKNVPLAPFRKLTGFSTADEIYMALQEVHKMIDHVVNDLHVIKQFEDAGEDEVGAPHAIGTRTATMAMFLRQLDLPTQQRMANAFNGTEASKMLGILTMLEKDMHVENNTVFTDPQQRKFLRDHLTTDMQYHSVCLENLQYSLGTEIDNCDAEENSDVNEGPAINIRLYLDELWDKASANRIL